MNIQLYETVRLINDLLKTLFSKRVILVAEPTHPNLGDQAQLMCTEKWISETFPNRKIVHLGMLFSPFDDSIKHHTISFPVIKLVLLKLFIKASDIFIGHSGYFFIDHHQGWFAYYSIVRRFKNQFVILPQTVNFYTPVVKEKVSKMFSNRKNLTILCRDEVSFEKAQTLFVGTKLLLYPDIVTSLIGTYNSQKQRDGIIFIMRDDIEQFYSQTEIENLMNRFGNIRKEKVDTTLHGIDRRYVMKHKDELINAMIEKISSYQVVITDRYHGTIFSAIASTPVVVINSADHKLSSGVKWFPKDIYGDMVQYANSLDEAYSFALEKLHNPLQKVNPPYFRDNYWKKLKKELANA